MIIIILLDKNAKSILAFCFRRTLENSAGILKDKKAKPFCPASLPLVLQRIFENSVRNSHKIKRLSPFYPASLLFGSFPLPYANAADTHRR
jgi:hypothetical protein